MWREEGLHLQDGTGTRRNHRPRRYDSSSTLSSPHVHPRPLHPKRHHIHAAYTDSPRAPWHPPNPALLWPPNQLFPATPASRQERERGQGSLRPMRVCRRNRTSRCRFRRWPWRRMPVR